MNLLIDTHAVIWFITKDSRLPESTLKLMKTPENKCFVSIASLWKIAIKFSLGRLELHTELSKIFGIIAKTGFEILPITIGQILINAELPFHHNDPFDRIIIAQAISEKLKIVSKDGLFQNYNVNLVWE